MVYILYIFIFIVTGVLELYRDLVRVVSISGRMGMLAASRGLRGLTSSALGLLDPHPALPLNGTKGEEGDGLHFTAC